MKQEKRSMEQEQSPLRGGYRLLVAKIVIMSFLILPTSVWAVNDCINDSGTCENSATCLEKGQGYSWTTWGGCSAPQGCCKKDVLIGPAVDEFYSTQGLKGIMPLLDLFRLGAGLIEGPQEPEVVAGKIILGFLVVIGVVFGILVIYGGYLWMTARGNEEQAKKAIGILETTIIGFIIVVGAYAITSYVVDKVITAAFPPPSP